MKTMILICCLLALLITACDFGGGKGCYDTAQGKLCQTSSGLQPVENGIELPNLDWPDYQDTSSCDPIQGPFCK